MCVRSLLKKKMLRFSKWSFIVILQFFLLIIMAAWHIKQTIVNDYNIQSCQWMAFDCFRQPLLLCTTFRSFLYTVHYFFCALSAKMATYSLVIDDVYFVISSYARKRTRRIRREGGHNSGILSERTFWMSPWQNSLAKINIVKINELEWKNNRW